MTLRIPKQNFADRLLISLGKKRGVIVPADIQGKFGPYAFEQAKRESFWKALFRQKGMPLPKGVLDWEEFVREVEKRNNAFSTNAKR
jgi:hypothetical protein